MLTFLMGHWSIYSTFSIPRNKLLVKMSSLKMVQTLSAGVDTLDFRSLPPGTTVFSNAGAFTASVAEHAWGLLLGVAKGTHLRNVKTTPRRLRRCSAPGCRF